MNRLIQKTFTYLRGITAAQFSVCCLCGILLSAIGSAFMLRVSGNITLYVGICVLFLFGAFVGGILAARLIPRQINRVSSLVVSDRPWTDFRSVLLCAVAVYLVGNLIFISDYLPLNTWGLEFFHEIIWHYSEFYTVLIAGAALVAMSVCGLLTARGKYTVGDKEIRWYAYYAAIALLYAFVLWQPNTTVNYSIYHRTAYFYDALARAAGIPYGAYTTGIYGHFGLIMLPFVKLLGGATVESLTFLTCVTAAVAVILFSLSVHNISRNKFIRFCAPLGFLLTFFWCHRTKLYYQGYPHRMLLTALFLYIVSLKLSGKPVKTVLWLARISSVFALIWSSDFGLVYFIAMLAFEFVSTPPCRKFLPRAAVTLLSAVCELAAVIGIINLYNLAVGGEFILSELLYPYNIDFVNSVIYVGLYNDDYDWKYSLPPAYAYFWITLFFLAFAVCFAIKAIKKKDIGGLVPCTAALYSVGIMVYYITRSAYGNFMQILPAFIFCAAYIADLCEKSDLANNGFMQRVQLILQGALVFMAVATVISTPVNVRNAVGIQQNESRYENAVEELRTTVPEGTCLLGIENYEIAAYSDWDNLYTYDPVHLIVNDAALEQTKEDILSMDSFVIVYIPNFFNYSTMSDFKDIIQENYVRKGYYEDESIGWTYYERITDN